MGDIDFAIAKWSANFGGHYGFVDGLVKAINSLPTFKMFPLVALLCVAAFQLSGLKRSALLLANGIIAGTLSLVVTRLIQDFAPARPRPASLPIFSCAFKSFEKLPEWSSFPSDTAGLAMAFTIVIWRSSKELGICAGIWTFAICAARVVGGYHYATDILAGLAAGAALATMVQSSPWISKVTVKIVERTVSLSPSIFCLVLIFTLFQFSTMFDDVRKSSSGVLESIGIVKKPPDSSTNLRSSMCLHRSS